MSEVDERIRREVQGLTRPVRTDGVLEHVARRRVRRGRVHRAGVIGLVVVVVAASVVGGIGLTKLFGHTAGAPATGGESPTPADWQRICDESALSTDLDGDGTGDEVSVFSPSLTNTCAGSGAGGSYVLHVSGGKLADHKGPGIHFYGSELQLTECTQPHACSLFAAPDLRGDGTHELVVQIAEQNGMRTLALFGLAGEGTEKSPFHFVRIGEASGGVTFNWGRSETEQASVTCRRGNGPPLIVASVARPAASKPGTFDVHETQYTLQGLVLHQEAVADYPGLVADNNPPFVTPSAFCGAPITGRGSSG